MKTKKEKLSLNGWLNINKPVGVTSTYIVNRLKRTLNPKKIGHAGTLDPAADGVLPIALGEATKTIEFMQDARKTYRFTVRFGETTDTLDKEGNITEKNDILPSLEQIQAALPAFTGVITQIPPAYSAIKIDGQRAYDLARAGLEVKIKPRQIEIFSLKIISNVDNNQKVKEATFEAECSKGTYIRTLGAGIAKYCQTIGYITFLQRIKVGSFVLDEAAAPEKVNENLLFDENEIKSQLKPIDAVLDDIPVLYPDTKACEALRNGLKLPTDSKITGIIRVYNDKKLIALAEVENGLLRTRKVFNL